jgi:translation initiation factor 1A
MVKNQSGGSKTKGQARKFITAKPSNTLRISHDESEVYAQVIKILGGAMCHVECIDGKIRLCHIRGKFRGRGKRDNLITNGTWILIGLREWEIGKESSRGKLENCDLLEVYNEHDKDKLKNTVNSVNWSKFIANDNKMISTNNSSDLVEFTDEKTEEYRQLIEEQISQSAGGNTLSIIADDGEEINVDDI